MSKVDIKMLTPKDIQDIFNIGKNQAYALMHSEGFPTVTLNNRMFVESQALEEWLDKYKGKQYIFNYI